MENPKYIITENGKRASDLMDEEKAKQELQRRQKLLESRQPAPTVKLEIKQNICG